MYKNLRIIFCLLAVICAAVTVFIFVYFGWWGFVPLGAGCAFAALMVVCKNEQVKQERKNNPPPPEGDFITGKVKKDWRVLPLPLLYKKIPFRFSAEGDLVYLITVFSDPEWNNSNAWKKSALSWRNRLPCAKSSCRREIAQRALPVPRRRCPYAFRWWKT